MNKILDALRSPGAMMVALVLALVAQGEHTAQVFAFFSHSNGQGAQPLAYAFAAAVEVAVLLFVLRGHKYISYAFAVATLCTNIVYYAIGGIDLLSVAIAPVLLLSALLPGVIVGYSHTIAETPHGAAAPTAPAKATTRRRWQFWRKPLETPTAPATPTDTTAAPSATPVQSGGHSEAANVAAKPTEQPSATSGARQGTTKGKAGRSVNPNRDRALQMRSEGFNASEIAGLLNEKESTVASWLYRGAQKNGVAK